MNRAISYCVAICLISLAPQRAAEAAPLSLDELDEFDRYLMCPIECNNGKTALLAECLEDCPSTAKAEWDKNLDSTVDEVDNHLAWLEYWDDGTLTRICYEGGAVVGKLSCGLQACLDSGVPADDCADADEDGLRKFQEDQLGTSDEEAQSQCAESVPCAGFAESCQIVGNGRWCLPRPCAASASCRAFHLEEVSHDDDEIIVRVHYDYSPVPATVLDLYVDYDETSLALLDARPLPALTNRGKTVHVQHTNQMKLRLVVLGTKSSIPIATGPIIELIFHRQQTVGGGTIGFDTNDYRQQWSMAPGQGEAQTDLSDDGLWGEAIVLKGATGDRLLLYYSFDNSTQPLDVARVFDGEALCTLEQTCAVLDEVDRDERIACYEALQSGVTQTSRSVEGVIGPGVFLDGYSDHLELPVTFNDDDGQAQGNSGVIALDSQSFTFSTWFYHDDDSARGSSNSPRVLFSHNTQDETTKFGVLVVQSATESDVFELHWFEDDITNESLETTLLAAGLPSLTWLHFAMTFDATLGQAKFYVDGQEAGTPQTVKGDVLQCPRFYNSGRAIGLHQEGELDVGGRNPEQIYFSSAKNNLYGVERMEANGLGRQELLRVPTAQAQDPHYSPLVDKIVYSGSASGSFEIWIADGNGDNPRQITNGFGDTSRGIFARRPKWAPDASAIVFESNVYNRESEDNLWAQGYNLYYIGYDPEAETVSIDSSGQTQLDYSSLVRTGSAETYRLTSTDGNYTNAQWLRGKDPAGADLGKLNVNYKDRRFEGSEVFEVTISSILHNTPGSGTARLDLWDDGSELSVFASHYRKPVGASGVTTRLWSKQDIDYVESSQFAVSDPEAVSPGVYEVSITYTPTGLDPQCWDTDQDSECDAAENIDGVDGCTTSDCYLAETGGLYLEYDRLSLVPVLDPDGSPVVETSSWMIDNNKSVSAFEVERPDASAIKVQVATPINSVPLAEGTEVAKLRFEGAIAAQVLLTERVVRQEFWIEVSSEDDSSATLSPFEVFSVDLERVLAADFSPQANRLVLSGLQNARPVVVTTTGIANTAGMRKISTTPMSVRGLQWVGIQRTYPCNWVGAHRHRDSGLYVAAFRGGLDEVKIFSYVRPSEAFVSESDTGHEWIEKKGEAGAPSSADHPCGTSMDCPAYAICDGGSCELEPCSPDAGPDDPESCSEGVCTLLPTPSGNATGVAWVCSVECSGTAADAECFERECLNGPCRYCSAQKSCIECKPNQPHDVGGVTLYYTDGCPDRNSFACDEGSCVSECYSFENDQSRYLCDSATEYCKDGRCAALRWEWQDLSPFSWVGLGEASFDLPGRFATEAIPQLYTIEIKAYGVDDYLRAPLLWVQGKVATGNPMGAFGTDWFDLGIIRVFNRTDTEADKNKYRLLTHEPITHLRFQLVERPAENTNRGATGLLARDDDFCGYPGHWAENDPTACFKRPSGSRAVTGYHVGSLELLARRQCHAQGRMDCGEVDDEANDPRLAYLHGGQPAVVIQSVEVDGTQVLQNHIVKNTVCSYEGTLAPRAPDGRRRRLWYGDVSTEKSNQQAAYFPAAGPGQLRDFMEQSGGLWGLLNCNYGDPSESGGAGTNAAAGIAELVLEFQTEAARLYPTSGTYGSITETANRCAVKINGNDKLCYDWAGEVTFDPVNHADIPFRTLDYAGFRASGY